MDELTVFARDTEKPSLIKKMTELGHESIRRHPLFSHAWLLMIISAHVRNGATDDTKLQQFRLDLLWR